MEQNATKEKTVIVHCSDIHYGEGFQHDRAANLLLQINELKPDAVVVSGDLTMRARRTQFRKARKLLEAIEAPLLVVPGNHDVPLFDLLTRVLNPFANYNKYISDLTVGAFQFPHVSILGLNTVNPWKHQEGIIRSKDLDRVREWSAEQPANSWKVVVVHQHFANLVGHHRPGVFSNGEYLIDSMAQAGIHAVLHGHVHYSNVVSSAMFFPDLKRHLALVTVGTATCQRTRGEVPTNHFNIIEFCEPEIHIRQCDWSLEVGQFVEERSVRFDRQFFQEELQGSAAH